MPWLNLSITELLLTLLALYVLVMGGYLVLENRRPQATLAWLLAFIFMPGVGLLVYVLFGRDRKAFSRQTTLLKQDLESSSGPLLSALIDRQDAAIARLEGKTTAHHKLMMLVRQNSASALTVDNRVEILQDAAQFYPRLIEDIRRARQSIHLQYFIWRADSFTSELKELLAAKVRDGVEVRLLYDPLGSRAYQTFRFIRAMREAGIRMVPTSHLWRLHTISYRNHRKITVIDGEIGYTGGMNIGREHIDGGEGFELWRDTQVRITGEGAAMLQAVFVVDWYNATRENLFAERYFAPCLPRPESDAPCHGDVPVQILTSGPDSRWAAIRQLYSLMIVSAERHVYIQSPYFILDASIAEALRTAALSGVDVKVMVSLRESGARLPTWAGHTYMADIVDAGVRVFLYEPGYLHAKTISIDSSICSIGSANIDIRSFSINYEINTVLYNSQLARELEQTFERDLARCIEFDADRYRTLPAHLRFRDSVARLLSPLL